MDRQTGSEGGTDHGVSRWGGGPFFLPPPLRSVPLLLPREGGIEGRPDPRRTDRFRSPFVRVLE